MDIISENNQLGDMTWNNQGVCSIWTVIGVYIFSHLGMLFIVGAWWDDTIVWSQTEKVVSQMFGPEDANNPFVLFIYNIFVRNGLPLESRMLLYRWFPFVCGLISVVSVFYVTKITTKSRTLTIITSLFAATLCIDRTFLLFVCCTYSASLALTLLGLLIFVKDYYEPKMLTKLLVAVLWGLAILIWRTPVAVIPYIIVVAALIKVKPDYKKVRSYQVVLKYIISNYWIIITFYLLAILAFMSILAPSATHAEYYAIHPINLLLSPITTLLNSFSFIIQLLRALLNALCFDGPMGLFFLGYLLLFFLIYYFLVHLMRPEEEHDNFDNSKLMLIAFGFLFFVIFPHMLNRSFSFYRSIDGWNSRLASMALLPLSLLGALFVMRLSYRVRLFFIALIIVSSVSLTFQHYLSCGVGWARNLSMTHFLKNNSYLKNKNILYINNASDLTVFGPSMDAFYEMESCARLAYGKNSLTRFENYNNPYYSDFVPDYYIVINRNKSFRAAQALLFKKYLMPDNYERQIEEMLDIEVFRPNEDISRQKR